MSRYDCMAQTTRRSKTIPRTPRIRTIQPKSNRSSSAQLFPRHTKLLSSHTELLPSRFLSIEHTEQLPRHTELLPGAQNLFPGTLLLPRYTNLLSSHADLLPGFTIAPWAHKTLLQSHKTIPPVHKMFFRPQQQLCWPKQSMLALGDPGATQII